MTKKSSKKAAEKDAEKADSAAATGRTVMVHIAGQHGKTAKVEREIPTGEISISARKDGHRRNGMVFGRTPTVVDADELGWTNHQWAEALGDRFILIGTGDDDAEAPGLTLAEEEDLAAGGKGVDSEATEPDTDEPESR